MLKEQAAQLEASKAEAEASVAQLRQVMSEKNTVERMLEEMERKKEAAEARRSACATRTITLLDTVTVLTDARAADHQAHAVTVRKWRDSLVAYQEKTPTEFLAEIVALVSDMDNEVEIEMVDADVAARRITAASASPRRRSSRSTRSGPQPASGDGGARSPVPIGQPHAPPRARRRAGADPRLRAATRGGTSGAEIKMSTPVQAAEASHGARRGGPPPPRRIGAPLSRPFDSRIKSVRPAAAASLRAPPCVELVAARSPPPMNALAATPPRRAARAGHRRLFRRQRLLHRRPRRARRTGSRAGARGFGPAQSLGEPLFLRRARPHTEDGAAHAVSAPA